ncbi:translin [Nilaparvata lugens]|uniref:translin n=1 Tax=Nilaparvata lugens TaxID=108931 RepID=UPI00193D6E76|nr:translin [Nilaparvata lugens]
MDLHFKTYLEEFQQHLTNDVVFFENIKSEVKLLEVYTASMSNSMNEIYSGEGLKNIPLYCARARENLPLIQKSFENIKKAFPEEDFFKFNHAWKTHTSQIAEWVLLIVFLERGDLCLKKEFSEIIGVENESQLGFHITLEEYLFGYLSMISDLVSIFSYSLILSMNVYPNLFSFQIVILKMYRM